MTMPLEFEIEAEPIDASHLLRARCTGRGGACGGLALCAPGQERTARCAACWGGSVVDPALLGGYGPVVGYPLGHVTSTEAAREPYPAPEVTSRDEWMSGATVGPSPVEKLACDGRERGWDVVSAYSRGCLPHGSTGAPTGVRDLFSVRFRRDAWGAYAVYANDAWVSIMMWGAALPWFPAGGVTDLREFLTDPARPEQWFDGIRERERLAAERRKARAACNRGQHAEARWIGDGVWCWWCSMCCHGWNMNEAPWRRPKKKQDAL